MSGIFRRAAETYAEDPRLVSWILADTCNPLNRIVAMIDAGTVLDIGCGTGILGRLLGSKAQVQVDGVDPAVANDHPGVQCYRRFFHGSVEQFVEEHGIDQYDWIVMADVIEHFAYPDEALKELVSKAGAGARFVISAPNIAHLSVRCGLANGRFDYTTSGILESTHLRFFTLKTFLQVLGASGLFTESVLLLNRIPAASELAPAGIIRAVLALAACANDELAMTYQFLALAKKDAAGQTRLEHVGERGVGKCYWNLARPVLARFRRLLGRAE